MKKIIGIGSGILSSLFLAQYAFAQADGTNVSPCPENTNGVGFSGLCNFSFQGLLPKIITLVFIVAILICLFFLIWGGIKWILSGGDKSAVEGARNHIVAAIVGLIIVFLSFFILSLVLKFFLGSGFGFSSLTLPTVSGQ